MGMDMESGKTQPKVLAMIIQGLFPWFAALGSGVPRTVTLFCCAEGAPSPGRSPGRSVVPYQPIRSIKNKKFGVLFTLL
jgi:hypothetical protein